MHTIYRSILPLYRGKNKLMILLTFKTTQGLRLGVKTKRGVIDVNAAYQSLVDSWGDRHVPVSPDSLFSEGLPALEALRDFITWALSVDDDATWLMEEKTLTYGPCVPNPGKILCVGLNYRQHAVESGMPIPETPLLFSKFNNSIAAPGENIPLPSKAIECDYEAELVVVMGREAKCVPEEKALDCVLGYCNGNDLSARDLQFMTSQWLLGKTLDKFMPIGPYLVTPEEVGDPQNLPIRCWLNDELRQDSNTADMIFSVAQIISFSSQYMTLDRGDIITTGTPKGVIFGLEEKVWLRPGDEVTVEIGNLGRLTNRMISEDLE